jgi:hypothetical protein
MERNGTTLPFTVLPLVTPVSVVTIFALATMVIMVACLGYQGCVYLRYHSYVYLGYYG